MGVGGYIHSPLSWNCLFNTKWGQKVLTGQPIRTFNSVTFAMNSPYHFSRLSSSRGSPYGCSYTSSTMLPLGKVVAKKGGPKTQALKVAKAVESSTDVQELKKARRAAAVFHHQKAIKRPRNPRSRHIGAAPRNKLDFYQILRHPLTTEAAMKCLQDKNTLVFIVDRRADKKEIKSAIQNIYDVQVKKVNTLIRPDGTKKAYVMLAAAYDTLDLAPDTIGI